MSDFGREIKTRREELGMKKYTLAQLSGVDPSYIAHLEKGSKLPSLEIARKICLALGLSLALFDLEANNEPQ